MREHHRGAMSVDRLVSRCVPDWAFCAAVSHSRTSQINASANPVTAMIRASGAMETGEAALKPRWAWRRGSRTAYLDIIFPTPCSFALARLTPLLFGVKLLIVSAFPVQPWKVELEQRIRVFVIDSELVFNSADKFACRDVTVAEKG